MEMGKSVKMARRKGKRPHMHLVELAASRPFGYLTKEEVERLFRAIPPMDGRDRLLFEVIYRHGLRRREAALLRWEHVSEGRVWITRLKRGRSGAYPIHPRTQRLLWTHQHERTEDENPYLFTSRQSGMGPLSPSTIYGLFRRYADLAGIPHERQHPHVLRHSIATHLLESGWDLADVQDWLGQVNIASTQVYAKVTNKRREAKYAESLLSDAIAANNAS